MDLSLCSSVEELAATRGADDTPPLPDIATFAQSTDKALHDSSQGSLALSNSPGLSQFNTTNDSVGAIEPQSSKSEVLHHDGADDTGDDDADFESHENSFYASLVMAQQLRRQRETTARVGAVTSSAAAAAHAGTTNSTATTASSRSGRGFNGKDTSTSNAQRSSRSVPEHQHSANYLCGPLSPRRASASHASSVSPRMSPSSSVPVKAPRTLQDLLAWRQEMLEARMKEQAQAQQQHKQQQQHQPVMFSQQQREDSLEFSGSVSSSNPRSGVFHRMACSPVLLSPQAASPPCLGLGSRQSSLTPQYTSLLSPVAVKEHTLTPSELTQKAPVTHVADGKFTVESQAAPPQDRRVMCQLPTEAYPLALRQSSTVSPTSGSSGLPSRTASRWMESRDRSTQMEEISDAIRLHDIDVGQSLIGRFGLLFLLFLILSYVFEAPFLPGGGYGFF